MNVELFSQFFQGRSDSADQSMSPSVEVFSILQVYVTVSLSIAYLYIQYYQSPAASLKPLCSVCFARLTMQILSLGKPRIELCKIVLSTALFV